MESFLMLFALNAAFSQAQFIPFASTPVPFLSNIGSPTPSPFYVPYPIQRSYFQPTFNPYYNSLPFAVPTSSFSKDNNIDGAYAFSFNNGNGKQRQESGLLKDAYIDKSGEPKGVQVIKGTYTYTTADGTPVQVSYVVDENGYRSTGIQIQAEEEKPTTTPATTEKPEKSEKEDEYKNKINYVNPFYNPYRGSPVGYNDPYVIDQFGQRKSDRYDLIKPNSFDYNRLRYESYNPFLSSWFNPYVDYNPYVRNPSNEGNRN